MPLPLPSPRDQEVEDGMSSVSLPVEVLAESGLDVFLSLESNHCRSKMYLINQMIILRDERGINGS